MEEPIRVVARINVQSGKEDEAKSILFNLIQPTHREPGCLHYELLQNHNNSTEFVLLEEWETQAALNEHTAASHTKAALAKMESLIQENPPNVQFYGTIA